MMTHAKNPGAGFRRYDEGAAIAEKYAEQFNGLPAGISPGRALTALKRAAPYIGLPRSVVQLVDTLFAWSKPADWAEKSTPVVWPSNEKLALKLGIGVRQVQHLLDRAVRAGLITHRDSANGHRVGKRDAKGNIIWAYGIVLSPAGARFDEFEAVAAKGAEIDATIDSLRRRLSCAARKIASLAKANIEKEMGLAIAEETHELAQSALRHVRGSRSVDALTRCVEQIEQSWRRLEGEINACFAASDSHLNEMKDSPSDVENCTSITTTNQPQSAKAVTSNCLAKGRSGSYDVRDLKPQTPVEADLDEYGIDPSFIAHASPDLCYQLDYGEKRWGDVIVVAERLVGQHGINRHAWHEACRIMGQKGAAASVIATITKHLTGEVHKPGAYLRGMSERAVRGELNLGRTFHGLKDQANSQGMRRLNGTVDIGAMIKRTSQALHV